MSNQLPTEDDLKKMSGRGMVCYALRCAMRVVDLTKPYSELHKKSLDCIKAATQFCLAPDDAARASAVRDADAAAGVAKAARAYADTRGARVAAISNTDLRDYAVARAAATIADDAADAVRVADAADATVAARAAYAATDAYANTDARAEALANEAESLRGVAYDTDTDPARANNYAAKGYAHFLEANKIRTYLATKIAAAIKADYAKLLELTGRQAGELGAPIDPGENGPLGLLWPGEVKDEVQELDDAEAEEKVDAKPLLKIFFDESSGLTDEDELLVLEYINFLYQQQGRAGLKIIDDQRHLYARTRERVPS